MAILKRIRNGTGDGAGRSRYALKKAVAVRTDIPSPLSLLVADSLSEELKTELVSEFNRHLLLYQGSYKTQHFVISFGHHLSKEEIEKVLDRISDIFSDPERLHLFVVHQEKHGTAVHIIESADPQGKLRHLDRKAFYNLKRQTVKELQPFLNEREKEVAEHFRKGIVTQDWKHSVELKAPERSWKEYIRKAVEEVTELLEKGEIDRAVRLLKEKKVEIVEVKAGEKTPTGKKTTRDNVYAVYQDGEKTYTVRLSKRMKATFSRYKTVFERLRDETRRIRERIRRSWQELENYIAENRRTESIEREAGTTGLNPEEVARIREVRERTERIRGTLEQYISELTEELGINQSDLERLAREGRCEGTERENQPTKAGPKGPVNDKDRERGDKGIRTAFEQIEQLIAGPTQEFGSRNGDRGGEEKADNTASYEELISKFEEWTERIGKWIGKGTNTDQTGIEGEDRQRYNLDSGRNQSQADMDRDRSQPTNKPDTADIPLWNQGTNRPDSKTGSTNAGTGPADIQRTIPESKPKSIEYGLVTGRLFVWVDQEKRMHISFWRLSENVEEIDLTADELDPCGIYRIAEIWKENECDGNLIFEVNGDANFSERFDVKELIKEVRENKLFFTYKKEIPAPHKTSGKNVVEVAPKGVEVSRFFLVEGGPVYEDEVKKKPEQFLDCKHRRVRELAEKILKQKKELEREMNLLRQKQNDDPSRGLGI